MSKEELLEEIDRLLYNAKLMEYKYALITTQALKKCKKLIEENTNIRNKAINDCRQICSEMTHSGFLDDALLELMEEEDEA